jgi:hypothetical protein
MACAPPSLNILETPASRAAYMMAASGRGQTAMMSRTPATLAGMAVINSEDGSGYRPAGT